MVPTIGPITATMFFIGEAPGAEEERRGEPFVGVSGDLLEQVFRELGIIRHAVRIGNVAKERPPANNINYFFEDGKKRCKPKSILQKWIQMLKREIEDCRPNIVIALGDIAYWALCGEHGIEKARGYLTTSTLVPGVKVLPTFHPAHVWRNWDRRFHFMLDIRKALKNSESPEIPKDTRRLVTSYSLGQYLEYLEYLVCEHTGPIAVDIETTQPSNHVDIMGIADSEEHGVAFPILKGISSNYSLASQAKLWSALALVFKEKEVIMQHGKYDKAVLWSKHRILIEKFVFDTMIAGHVIWPEAPRSLEFLTSICTNYPAWKSTAMAQPLLYNVQDATNTFAIYKELKPIIDRDENFKATFDHEMAQNDIAILLEIQGVFINKQKQELKVQELTLKIQQLEKDLNTFFGKEVNFNSPAQLKQLLYVDLNLPPQYKRRKSRYDAKKVTTDAEALKKLFNKTGNKVLEQILELKKLYKLKTFIDVETSSASKVHTSYNITGATMSRVKQSERFIQDDAGAYKSFGRWSSSKSIIFPYGSGNLQNIPKEARKIYTAPEGYEIVQADLKQAEAVVVAYLIGDQRLIQLFKDSFGKTKAECDANNWDIHKLTAVGMFTIDFEQVTKELRIIGKRLRHATNYNAGAGVVATNLGVSIGEAKKLLQLFHNGCPQLKIWHKSIQQQLHKDRTLVNLLGRKHKFMGRWGEDLFRSAYSFLPQSTVGDLLNTALRRLYKNHGHWLTIYLQLHDAIYVLSKIEERAKAISAMKEAMLIPLTAPSGEEFTIDVDFSVGQSWGEMEEIDWQDYCD